MQAFNRLTDVIVLYWRLSLTCFRRNMLSVWTVNGGSIEGVHTRHCMAQSPRSPSTENNIGWYDDLEQIYSQTFFIDNQYTDKYNILYWWPPKFLH